jgi:hypothetical protein
VVLRIHKCLKFPLIIDGPNLEKNLFLIRIDHFDSGVPGVRKQHRPESDSHFATVTAFNAT